MSHEHHPRSKSLHRCHQESHDSGMDGLLEADLSELQPKLPKRGKLDSETLARSEGQVFSESSAYPSDPDSHNDSDSTCSDAEASTESTTTCTENTSSESRGMITDITAGPLQEPVEPLDRSYPIRKFGKKQSRI